ncbi:MAG: hypothetical protein EKK55_17960 [Rhodocyclaceae bacterium]|nr:MAG: hypothetical protein EKK55_17960 [Rhodocyclaceae bacterium]
MSFLIENVVDSVSKKIKTLKFYVSRSSSGEIVATSCWEGLETYRKIIGLHNYMDLCANMSFEHNNALYTLKDLQKGKDRFDGESNNFEFLEKLGFYFSEENVLHSPFGSIKSEKIKDEDEKKALQEITKTMEEAGYTLKSIENDDDDDESEKRYVPDIPTIYIEDMWHFEKITINLHLFTMWR